MTAAGYGTAEEIRERVCGTKVRHRLEQHARVHLEDLQARHPDADPPFGIYPCPFAGARRHWHVGHVPSLEALEAIALVIRGLDPVAPVPHDPPAKSRRSRKARRQ